MTTTLIDTCARCGATIELRPVSDKEQNFRWFASSKRTSWHCGNDPEFPVRAHAPATKRAADLPHEYEAERGDIEIDGPCAICGALYPAMIHTTPRTASVGNRKGANDDH